jgi:glyoxylate/hydroxypyruvate reductase A
MAPSVLVAARGWDGESWRQRMQAHLPTHVILNTARDGLYAGPDSDLADVSYLLAWRLRQETLDRLPRLSAIFSLGAGVDHIFALQRLPNVSIARIVDPDLTGRMTDYVVWQVLDHFRRGPTYRRQQSKRIWDELDQPATRDVTVGILGLGSLGRDAADVLLRLGFRVRGWSRSGKSIAGVEDFHGSEGLDGFLADVDILVALLPLTPETRGLIDAKLLHKLRKGGPLGGPVLINAGRGGSHVETDVTAALRDGTLVGATLDVFEREPLPPDSPLWELGNLTITPHFASASDPEALCKQIADQIKAVERGEPLKNRVDPARGY